MPKPKRCTKCGVERNVTVVATVTEALAHVTLGFKRLCIPCLLGVVKVPWEEGKKLAARPRLVETVEDAIEEQCENGACWTGDDGDPIHTIQPGCVGDARK